jgi:hypothetical protein
MKNCAKMFVIASAFAVSAGSAYAVDYLLEAGQTDTISTNVTYANMDVYGDLSVYVPGGTKKDYKKYVRFTSNLNLIGGSLTIDPQGQGSYFQFGYSGGKNNPNPNVNITNGVDGSFGTILIRNINADPDTSLCCEKLIIRKEGEGTAPENGIIDFARIENGYLFARQLYNYSSCTGRVTIAGGGISAFCRRGRSAASDFVANGPFIVRIEDGSTWNCYFYNNKGDFNKSGESIVSEGIGNVAFNQRTTSTASFRSGAYLNHLGSIYLRYDETSQAAYFAFEGSDIIGPNVTNIVAGTSPTAAMKISFSANVVQTVKNISISGAGPYLTGGAGSKLRINADDGDRTVKLNIKSGDPLTVEKIGEYEAVVSATTNFSHLVVSEGIVRITDDCVIEDISVAAGAKLIVDGCRVTLPVDESGEAIETINGGVLLRPDDNRVTLHYTGATTVFEPCGIDKKRWRWTFFSINNGPTGLSNRALYLFAADGTWQNEGLAYASEATEQTTTVLAEKKCRWVHDSSTTLAHDSDEDKWGGVDYLKAWFDRDEAGNHSTILKTPVIYPDDPTTWVGVEMHLSSSAAPITGYNMRVRFASKYANGWKVETSDDGVNWELVDIRSNQVFAISSGNRYATYDNVKYIGDQTATLGQFNATELFHFTAYRSDGMMPTKEPVSLRVDGGASIDLRAFVGKQLVDALTVDCAAGTGIIQGAQIAESGVLTIVNADELLDGATLPLSLPESIDGANIKNWSVVIDGVKKGCCVKIRSDGTMRLSISGMRFIVR